MKIIALEIGSSAVKVGVAQFDPAAGASAPVTMLAVEEEPLPAGVRFGRIHNVEDVKSTLMLALHRLQANPALHGAEVTGVYTAIGGRTLGTVSTQKAISLPDEMLIDRQIVERLKNEALDNIPAGRDVLDVIALDYTVDGVRTQRPVGSYGRSLSGRFTVVVCDPLNARNIERVLTERLNLSICGYVVRPLAIAQAALTAEDLSAGVMLVDFGAETTTVSIYHRGNLVYIATIPLGSRNITRDLANGLAVTEERADEMKIRLGNAIADGPVGSDEQQEIDNYVQARATEIVDNIIAHIEFAGFKAEDLRGGIIITGRGAKLRNFCTLLSRQSKLPVRTAMPPAQAKIADPSINPADNLDLIAITLQAARLASMPDALPCLSEPEPAPVKVVEPKPDVKSQANEPAEETEDDNPYEKGVFERIDGDEPEYEDDPVYEDSPADTDVLLDDDEEDELRARRAARAAAARAAAEKEAAKENKTRERKSLSKWLSSLGTRVSDMIRDENEGVDLDE